MELVRVNQAPEGGAMIVAGPESQDQSDCYYYREPIRLARSLTPSVCAFPAQLRAIGVH